MARTFGHSILSMFDGSIVALITPFSEDGGLDLDALSRLVSFHLEEGSSALVVAGTTGESATLEPAESEALLEAVIRLVDGKIPVIAGTGSASTRHAIEQSQAAESLGASAVLVVTPYYNRPTQAGLAAHFEAVADAIGLPLIMYNVPSRTAVDLQPETAVALSRHEGIVGLKESVADLARVEHLVTQSGSNFAVLSGDDPTCLAAMRAGASGVISVAANVAPRRMREMCNAASAGDWEHAARIDGQLERLYETLALETNPIPVKWAAFEMGLVGPAIRLPLLPLDEQFRGAVRECLDELEITRATT